MTSPLEALLAPLTLQEFVETYWDRRSLRLRGTPDRFSKLLNRQTLSAMLRPQTSSGAPMIAYLKAGREESGRHVDFQSAPERAEELLATGYTLQIEDVDRYLLGVQSLREDARRALCLQGHVNVACFLSPPGSGYGLHYDISAMWVMQVSGSKQWRYGASPVRTFPMQNCIPGSSPGDFQNVKHKTLDLEETILTPGDVLYLPAGTWHRVQAIDESLHLCLSLFPAPPVELIMDALRDELLAQEDWRRPLHRRADTSGDPTAVEDDVKARLAASLYAFRGAVQRLTVDDLLERWRVERD